MYDNIKISDIYRQELKKVSFETTTYDDFCGEFRTRKDEFEVSKSINYSGQEVYYITCHTRSEIDGIKTTREVLVDIYTDETETIYEDLSNTSIGKYILSLIKDWKI